jgi:hypothetical protein
VVGHRRRRVLLVQPSASLLDSLLWQGSTPVERGNSTSRSVPVSQKGVFECRFPVVAGSQPVVARYYNSRGMGSYKGRGRGMVPPIPAHRSICRHADAVLQQVDW